MPKTIAEYVKGIPDHQREGWSASPVDHADLLAWQRELMALLRDYALFEECSPPGVPRTEFVRQCFDAWKRERQARPEPVELKQKNPRPLTREVDDFDPNVPPIEEVITEITADKLAESQNVKPMGDVRALFDTWPGEVDDGFEEAIDELRHPDTQNP